MSYRETIAQAAAYRRHDWNDDERTPLTVAQIDVILDGVGSRPSLKGYLAARSLLGSEIRALHDHPEPTPYWDISKYPGISYKTRFLGENEAQALASHREDAEPFKAAVTLSAFEAYRVKKSRAKAGRPLTGEEIAQGRKQGRGQTVGGFVAGAIHCAGNSRGGAGRHKARLAEHALLNGQAKARAIRNAEHQDLSPGEARSRQVLLQLVEMTEERMRNLTGRTANGARGINNRRLLGAARDSLLAQLEGTRPVAGYIKRLALDTFRQ